MLVILVSCYMLCIFPLALAQVTPTTPGPNATYDADSNCTIAWITDNSGSWTNMSIGKPSCQCSIFEVTHQFH